MRARLLLLGFCLAAISLDTAIADPFLLVTGRRDPRIYAIDLAAALKPENNNTPNAIVARTLVAPRRLDGVMLGDPANVVLSADQKTAYVMNHHGAIANAEFLQHGARANIAVMDTAKMIDRASDNTDAALLKVFDGGWFGGGGLLVVPDVLVASAPGKWLGAEASNRLRVIDPKNSRRVHQIER